MKWWQKRLVFRMFAAANCPYCKSENIKQTANMRGVRMIVIW